MREEITRVDQLGSQDEYKDVMIYIYSGEIDILQNMKEKILQMDEKCSATFGQRNYYEKRPMLIIQGDFSSEHLKDIFDYLSGQNIAYASVNEPGELKISNRPIKPENNEGPDQGIIPDNLADTELKGVGH
jgi:hypothetical protein